MDTRSYAEDFRDTEGQGDPVYAVDAQIAPAYADEVSEEWLRRIAEAALHAEGMWGQVAIVITDDEGIRELNRDFLGNDEPTDVLAFSAKEEAEGFVAAPEVDDYLGDVIVSYPRAAVQAKEAGHPTQQEIALLVIHGLLHLLGYDHADEAQQAAMWARQEALLRLHEAQ